MLGQGAQAPSIEVQRFGQAAFSMANFLKYFVRKNWRGGGELMNVIEKWYNRLLRLLNMLLLGRIYIALGP